MKTMFVCFTNKESLINIFVTLNKAARQNVYIFGIHLFDIKLIQ